MTDNQKMWSTLKAISDAESIDRLKEGKYGLSYEEALEMAYENLKFYAKSCINEVNKPNV